MRRPARSFSRPVAAVVVAVGLAALHAGAARGANPAIAVNSFDDLPDANLFDGVCDADLAQPGDQCTLRAAVQHANVTPGADDIQVPAGTYRLRIRGEGEDSAATGDLDLLDDVTITGAGASVTIVDAKAGKDRAFDVPSLATVSIGGLTIRGGKTTREESGGGIRNLNGDLAVADCVITKCKAGDDAGALDCQGGSVTVRRCWFHHNKARDDGGGIDLDGGSMTVEATTLSSNKAGSEGGGVENSGWTLTLVNVTVSGNKAKTDGGGISLEDGGVLTLQNCTIARNRSKAGGGIDTSDIQFGFNTANVSNTIVAGNKKTNCRGGLTPLGGNLDSGTTCGFGAGNLSGTDPLLGPLADNGGPVPTHALLAGSPCVDAGTGPGCPATDQRGQPRDVACDIGAYEAAQQ